MLILTRHPVCNRNEVVLRLGDTLVVVKVCGVDSNGRVKLAFDAPAEVRILRGELLRGCD